MVERRYSLSKDAVTAETVAPDSVGTEELKNGAVTTPKISNGAVETGKLSNDSVTSAKLQCIKYGIVSIDPPSIAAGSTESVDVAVSEITSADKIVVSCQGMLENGLVPIAALCHTDGTLTVRISNWSSAAVDGTSQNWLWVAYKF